MKNFHVLRVLNVENTVRFLYAETDKKHMVVFAFLTVSVFVSMVLFLIFVFKYFYHHSGTKPKTIREHLEKV